jgi:glycerophosphoryl diester phosphodiesterase
VVELKTSRWQTGCAEESAALLATGLRRLGVGRRDDVVVSSFDRTALAALRARLDVPTAVLGAPSVPAGTVVRWALDGGHDQAHPHVRALLFAPPSLVRRAHALGVGVTAWTADRRGDVRRLAERHVDAAICDDPAAARAALDAGTYGSPTATALRRWSGR